MLLLLMMPLYIYILCTHKDFVCILYFSFLFWSKLNLTTQFHLKVCLILFVSCSLSRSPFCAPIECTRFSLFAFLLLLCMCLCLPPFSFFVQIAARCTREDLLISFINVLQFFIQTFCLVALLVLYYYLLLLANCFCFLFNFLLLVNRRDVCVCIWTHKLNNMTWIKIRKWWTNTRTHNSRKRCEKTKHENHKTPNFVWKKLCIGVGGS